MRRTRALLTSLVPLTLTVALLASACGNDDDSADTTVAVTETTATASTETTEAASIETTTAAATETTAASSTDTTVSATAGAPTAAAGTITIGGFGFSESSILAGMYAGALRQAGVDVKLRLNLGNREIVAPALQSGEIDLVPEYAATALEYWNKAAGEATGDPAATVAKLNERLGPLGLAALTASPANDQNAFAVTKATADKYSLKTLSDLAKVSKDLTLGGPPECPERPFCGKGLEATYGATFKQFRALDAGGPLTKTALEKGDIDVGLVFSSDGGVAAKGFVVLEDDKQLQNADNIVPLGRAEKLTPEVRAVLDEVSAALTTGDLAALNKRADLDKEDPEVLAAEWLKSKGLGGS